jgi:predicted DNA-binding transcriptional regulator AlpA
MSEAAHPPVTITHRISSAGPLQLIRKRPLCEQLVISTWTLDRWIAAGKFPKPIYPIDGSPAHWRVRDVDLWLQKRQASRRQRPTPRGELKQHMLKIRKMKRGQR